MPAYYNENDPFAATWILNLMADGQLQKGEVDGRSINQVRAADLAEKTQVHLFAGVGGWGLALQLAGWPEDWPCWTGSCPCQPYSAAGKGQGNLDARNLWPEMFRLIRECRPPIIFGEQVSNAIGHGWLDGIETEDVQRVRHSQTLIGVLQKLQGQIPDVLQGMLSPQLERAKENDDAGRQVWEFPQLPEEEPGEGAGGRGTVPRKSEGDRIHSCGYGHSSPPICDRCREVRSNGTAVQSRRRKNMGQSVDRSDRQQPGLRAGKCADCALLRERHGQPVGAEQDHGNSQGNEPGAPGGVRRSIGSARDIFEIAAQLPALAGIRSDMEAIGYAVGSVVLGAHSVSAPHARQRLFWVANRERFGRERSIDSGSRQRSSRGRLRSPDSGDCVGGLGVADGTGSQPGRTAGAINGHGHSPLPAGSDVDGLGDAAASGQRSRPDGTSRNGASRIGMAGPGAWSDACDGSPSDGTGGLGDNGHVESRPRHASRLEEEERSEPGIDLATPGELREPWSDAYLVPCADQKIRRVGSGVFPLAHGIPTKRRDPRMGYVLAELVKLGHSPKDARRILREARSNRVGRLRGYGNAIVPQLAAEFIRATMEVMSS